MHSILLWGWIIKLHQILSTCTDTFKLKPMLEMLTILTIRLRNGQKRCSTQWAGWWSVPRIQYGHFCVKLAGNISTNWQYIHKTRIGAAANSQLTLSMTCRVSDQTKGGRQNSFSEKLGLLAQPAGPPPPPRKLGRQKKKKKFNVYFAF